MASLVKSISLNFRRRRALRKGGKDDTLEHAAHPVVGSPDEVLSPRALDHIDEATGKFQNLFNGRQNIWQRWEETDSAGVLSL